MSPHDATLHVVDTSVLVNIRDRQGDSEVIWNRVREEIIGGRLKTVRHVWDELKRRFPLVFARIKDLREEFLIPDAETYSTEVAAEIRAIQRDHPRLYDQLGAGNPADPFIIAVAKAKSAVVVTDEKRSGSGHRAKIPHVCTLRNVGCTHRVPFLKSLGLDV